MIRQSLWTALITPMNEDGSVDYPGLEVMLRKQEEAGNGVLVLGSTGEGLNLNAEEKRAVVKFAMSQKLKVPVMAGIGGYDLHAQKEFIRFCDANKVDALLLVTPLYAKPGQHGQYEWFKALLSETQTPCMLYNVPSRTGVKMHPSVPGMLSKEFDHILGIKEASGSVEEFTAFKDHAPDLDLYSGDDGMTPDFAREGAVGLVSVASNVWPDATHRYTEMCLAGDTDDLFPLWKEATDILFKAPNPTPAKVLARSKGWIKGEAVRLPLSIDDVTDELRNELEQADQAIAKWYSKHQD